MSWVRLDDVANQHPKLLAVGAEAAWLWTCGLMYASRQKARDGFIPKSALQLLYPMTSRERRRAVARLVECGLWHVATTTRQRHRESSAETPREQHGDSAETAPRHRESSAETPREQIVGWFIHDFADYQPSASASDTLREKRSNAGHIGGLRSVEARRQTSGSARPPPKQTEANSEATCFEANEPPSRPVPARPEIEDPPIPPRGGSKGSLGLEEPEPETLPPEERYRRAFVRGVVEATGATWSFPSGLTQQGALNASLPAHAKANGKALRGDNLDAWIVASVSAFVRWRDELPESEDRFWPLSPKGWQRWLNEGHASSQAPPSQVVRTSSPVYSDAIPPAPPPPDDWVPGTTYRLPEDPGDALLREVLKTSSIMSADVRIPPRGPR